MVEHVRGKADLVNEYFEGLFQDKDAQKLPGTCDVWKPGQLPIDLHMWPTLLWEETQKM